MSETSWEERREFEQRLYQGKAFTSDEMIRLIEDADAGERAEAMFEGLVGELEKKFGIVAVDATTDDDNGEIRIELFRESDPERPDSIGE